MPTIREALAIPHPTAGARVVADQLVGGGPDLVFLHGLVSVRVGEKSTALFAHAARHRLGAWRFDFRGHGDSSGELADTSLSDLVTDAAAVLDASGPAHLVGSSLGGLVAAWTAARRPDRVLSLTLLAPAFRFLERLIARSDADGNVHLDHTAGVLRFGPNVLADFREHDEADLARRIRCPVLTFHGEHDDVVPIAASREFHTRLRGVRHDLRTVRDGDHRLNLPIRAILEEARTFHDHRPLP